MPKMVLTASYFSLNGVNRSDRTNKIELSVEVDEQDMTTFASLGWKEVAGGLKSGQLGAEFKQDAAAGQIDEAVWALIGQVVPFEVRLDNAAVGLSNPKYTGNVLVKGWTPISGSVGDGASVSVSWPTSGAVARATA
jgi:hypothetical protein